MGGEDLKGSKISADGGWRQGGSVKTEKEDNVQDARIPRGKI